MKSGIVSFILFLTIGIVLIPGTSLKAQKTFTDAVEYNDYIVDHQNEIGRKIIQFNEVMADENVSREALNPYYEQMLAVTQDAVNQVKAMPPYKGNTELRDSAVDLFSFYLGIFREEYVEMLDIVFAESPSEEDFTRMETIMTDIGEEEKGYDEKFGAAQTRFAELHGFTLEENELQEKIDE